MTSNIVTYMSTHMYLECIYWEFAVVMSIFWGLYGIIDEANEDTKTKIITKEINGNSEYTEKQVKYLGEITNIKEAWNELGFMYASGAFLSDFLWSILGWSALYLLLSQYCNEELIAFNVFLGVVSIVGITGYGFKIPDKIKIG